MTMDDISDPTERPAPTSCAGGACAAGVDVCEYCHTQSVLRTQLQHVGKMLKLAIELRTKTEEYCKGRLGTDSYTFRVVRILRKERNELLKYVGNDEDELKRVGGDVICTVCGDRYGSHHVPEAVKEKEPTIVRLCDGTLGKT